MSATLLKCILLCSVMLPAAAQAQAVAEPTDTPPDQDIVVTAQRRGESINKVPVSINAISGSDLRNNGISQLQDLVKSVPGFNYTRNSFGAPVPSIRGIGFNETSLAAAPTVSSYLDEIPFVFAGMTSGASLDLERLEVLKGPQGTLYGQNATGGAINYITAKPTSQFAAGVTTTLGNYDTTNVEGYVSGPLADGLRIRVSGRHEYMGPWQKSSSREDRLGRVERNAARVLLEWAPTSAITATLNLNYWNDHSDSIAAQFISLALSSPAIPSGVVNYTISPMIPRAADWDAGQRFPIDDNQKQASLRLDWRPGSEITVTSLTSYIDYTRNARVDIDGTSFQNATAINPGRIKSFYQELRLSKSFANDSRWLVGANYSHDKVSDSNLILARDSRFFFDTAEAIGANDVSTYAVFANVDQTLSDLIKLQGGIRYTKQDREFTGCLRDTGDGTLSGPTAAIASRLAGTPVTILPGQCATLSSTFRPVAFNGQLNEDNVSWRGAINITPSPTALLYISASKGYKNGTFVTTSGTSVGVYQPAKQESVLAYEAGTKLSLLDRHLQFNAAAFYYDYRDKQVRGRFQDPNLGSLFRLLNVPKSRVVGGEVSATALPATGLRINAAASLSDTKILGNFTNFSSLGRLKKLSGEAFPLTPKWQLSGDIEYRRQISSTLDGFVGAAVTYQSSTNAGLGNEALLDMNGYSLVDLRAGLETSDKAWRAGAFVRNLGNTYYYTNVTSLVDTVVRYAGMPRTFGLTLSWQYR